MCGKFIKWADIESGKATMVMVTPDSQISVETWENVCARCNERNKNTDQ